jgi:hypothetical protein
LTSYALKGATVYTLDVVSKTVVSAAPFGVAGEPETLTIHLASGT